MTKDERIGLWLCALGPFVWLLGAGSFGMTGLSELIIPFAILAILMGPFVFPFGVYLLVKGQFLRWRGKIGR